MAQIAKNCRFCAKSEKKSILGENHILPGKLPGDAHVARHCVAAVTPSGTPDTLQIFFENDQITRIFLTYLP